MRYSEIFNVSAEALEAKGVFNADVDSDGKVLLTDLARLRQFISHVINKF